MEIYYIAAFINVAVPIVAASLIIFLGNCLTACFAYFVFPCIALLIVPFAKLFAPGIGISINPHPISFIIFLGFFTNFCVSLKLPANAFL